MFEFLSPEVVFFSSLRVFCSTGSAPPSPTFLQNCRYQVNFIQQSPFQGSLRGSQLPWAMVSPGLSQHASCGNWPWRRGQCPAGDHPLVMPFYQPWLGQASGLPTEIIKVTLVLARAHSGVIRECLALAPA